MKWLRYLSALAVVIGAVLGRVPLYRIIGPIQLGVAQTAKEAGSYARKCLIFSVIVFAAAYWFDKLDISVAHEISLATQKVGALWSDFVARKSPDGDIMPLFNAPGKLPEKANFTGIARLLLIAFMFFLIVAAMLLAVLLLLGLVQHIYGMVGGARFARRREVAAVQNPRGAAFGHYRGAPLLLHTDKHVLIMASTRSGKGIALIIPHLLRYRGSAFVLDPKGENARATGRRRAELNDEVHYLDPFGISGKPQSRFNPLSRFTPENMEAESKALATALVFGERDHWIGSAQQLLAAFILYVFTAPADSIPPDKKDLNTVRRLLLSGVDATLRAMTKSDLADGLLSDLAASFQNTPPNEFGSIVSTAQRETEILDNPDIARCLAASGDAPEVDFSAWHMGTMTVFLCLAAPKFPVFNRWLRLVLTSALDQMTDRLNPPPLPVCFMLDELATLGHLPVVENAVGLAAGYGVQLFTVFQDVAQMRDLYKNRWASFISNAGVRAVFNLDDIETARYWSEMLGQQVTQSVSRSQDIYGITQGQSSSDTLQPVLRLDELMLRYASGKMLVLPQGSRAIEADRVPYFDDRALDGLWDDPRGPVQVVPPPVPVPVGP
jgi:type IV secretion system protein VirD4